METNAGRRRPLTAMASPQREDGHLDVANELAEALAYAPLSGTQFRLLWVILRKTYGWQKKMDMISASQFADATGIHRKVVERELRELTQRRYIIAWGDNHHPKTYGIQKDWQAWDDGEVGTKMLPLRAPSGNQNDPKWEQNGSKVGTKMLTTITTTQKPSLQKQEEPETHVSGTLRERFEVKYQQSANKPAVFGELFSLLLGGTPDYRRLGAMAKRLNSGGKLLDLMIEASKRRISDNPHDYLDRMVSNEIKRQRKEGSAEKVVLDNGREVSADVHRSISQIANLDLGGR